MSVPSDTSNTSVPHLDPSHELPAQASSSDSPEGGHNWVRILVILVVILGAIAFVVWRIQGNKKDTAQESRRAKNMADRPVPVATEKAELKNIPIYLTALGTVTAYNTVTLKSRVDGQITQVNFQEGQHVKQGQLLIRIDPRPYEAALAQAKGNLARDQANAALAKTQSNRYTALYNAGVVSRESEQTQQSTAGQAAGTLEGDQAAIQAAQVNLGYTRITSPISGVVGLRQVDIGNIVAANATTGLVVITQIQPIAVIFTLPEDQLPQVREHMQGGAKLVVEAWDRANTTKIATGSLLTVDNQIDTTTGTAKLKAIFPNNDEALFPNQFVNIRLVLETRNALLLSAATLQTASGGGNFVYVVDTSKTVAVPPPASAGKGGNTTAGQHQQPPAYLVHARPVKVDMTLGSQVLIADGLKPGEVVVSDGQEKLQDESKVNLRSDTTGSPEAAAGKEKGTHSGATTNSPGGKPNSREKSADGSRGEHGSGANRKTHSGADQQ